jgi:hypothetical protein
MIRYIFDKNARKIIEVNMTNSYTVSSNGDYVYIDDDGNPHTVYEEEVFTTFDKCYEYVCCMLNDILYEYDKKIKYISEHKENPIPKIHIPEGGFLLIDTKHEVNGSRILLYNFYNSSNLFQVDSIGITSRYGDNIRMYNGYIFKKCNEQEENAIISYYSYDRRLYEKVKTFAKPIEHIDFNIHFNMNINKIEQYDIYANIEGTDGYVVEGYEHNYDVRTISNDKIMNIDWDVILSDMRSEYNIVIDMKDEIDKCMNMHKKKYI